MKRLLTDEEARKNREESTVRSAILWYNAGQKTEDIHKEKDR